MEIVIIVALMLLGIILLLVEMFLIPGISVAGIGGSISMIISIVLAFRTSFNLGWLVLGLTIFIVAFLIWFFFKSKAMDRMSLLTRIDSKVESLKDLEIKVGDKGITVSRMMPMGKVKVNGYVVEAKTNDGFIDENTSVVVEAILSNAIQVGILDKI